MSEPPKVRWRGDFWDVNQLEVVGPVVEINGKTVFRKDCVSEVVDPETKKRVATSEFKAGETFFPAMYYHEAGGYIGETVDARRNGDDSEWLILIAGVDRDSETGEPIINEYGDFTYLGGWFRESALIPFNNPDGEIPQISFVPGHTRNVNEELAATHTQKLLKFRAFYNVGGKMIADLRKKGFTSEVYRWINEHLDQPAKRAALLSGEEYEPEGWSRPEGERSPVIHFGMHGRRFRPMDRSEHDRSFLDELDFWDDEAQKAAEKKRRNAILKELRKEHGDEAVKEMLEAFSEEEIFG